MTIDLINTPLGPDPFSNTISMKTMLTNDGFEQHLDILGTVSRKVANVLAIQADAAFRIKLVEMGWIPPAGDDPTAMMLLLKAAYQQGFDAAGQWQPIETAPKDRAPILLFDKYEGQTVGFWCPGYGRNGEWICAFMGGTVEQADMEPMHWKPLGPEPPVPGP